MALATRCPACGTVFRISTAQAAAKGGMVRCGQCRNVFNSLDALVRVEDLEIVEEMVVDPPPERAAADHAPADPMPAAAVDAPSDGSAADASVSTTVGAEGVEADPHPPPIGEWWLPHPADAPTAPAAPSIERSEADRLVSGRRTDLQAVDAGPDGIDPTFMQPEAVRPTTGAATRWVLGFLCIVALVGLVGQGAYQWRDELAARWPPARPWLDAACVPLRCRVDYPAHLDAIAIESANVQIAGPTPNVYLLTALLRNRDAVAVRLPHLELVLTDLQDRPILRRALRPEDYLPLRRDVAGFAAESELPIRLTFELTDLQFAGYRLDRFYP